MTLARNAACLLALTACPTAQLTRISAPLVQAQTQDVELYSVSPFTELVVFLSRGDAFLNAGTELFVAPTDGSHDSVSLAGEGLNEIYDFRVSADGSMAAFVTLGTPGQCARFFYTVPTDASRGPLGVGAYHVPATSCLFEDDWFEITPSGDRIVYQRHGLEFFSAPSDGSTLPTRLTPPGPTPIVPALSEDGEVLFFANDPPSEPVGFELFSVRVDGSAPPAQLTEHGQDPGVIRIQATPDRSRVIYLSGQEGKDELYSVRADGSEEPIRLNLSLPAAGDVLDDFRIDPTGTYVVYSADAEIDERFDLFAVRVDGLRPATPLSSLTSPGGSVLTWDFVPDGTRVVYIADPRAEGHHELFVSRTAQEDDPVRLNAPLIDQGDVTEFSIALDGRTVVYLADSRVDEQYELFAAPIARAKTASTLQGPEVVRLHGDLPADADVQPDFRVSHDGRHAVFRIHQAGVARIHAATLEEQPECRLLETPFVGEGPLDFRLLSSTYEIVVRGDLDPLSPPGIGLVGLSLDESFPARILNAPLAPRIVGDVFNAVLVEDDQRAVYVADQIVDGKVEIFTTRTDGTGIPVRLNSDLAPLENVGTRPGEIIVAPGGRRIAYITRGPGTLTRLYTVLTDASEPAEQIGGTFQPVNDLRFSADGQHVVFLEGSSLASRIHAASIADPATTHLLTPPLGPYSDIEQWAITPDSQRVLFTADPTFGWVELFSAPIDGSEPATSLLPGLLPDRDVQQFEVSPDESQVLFVSNYLTPNQKFGLYSTPLDGDGTVSVVDNDLPGGGDVEEFAFDPTSQYVVWLADGNVNNVIELWSRPLDLSAPRIQLNPPLVAGGDVLTFWITPDGQDVVYAGDLETDNQLRGYRVPIDGSAAPTPFHDYVGDDDFSITPNGELIVYWGGVNNRCLRAEPLDGTSPSLLLDEASPSARFDYELTSDGEAVVYGRESDRGLFWVPVDGSHEPIQINDPQFPFPNDELNHSLTADGTRILYVGDDLTRSVVELFIAPLPQPRVKRSR